MRSSEVPAWSLVSAFALLPSIAASAKSAPSVAGGGGPASALPRLRVRPPRDAGAVPGMWETR